MRQVRSAIFRNLYRAITYQINVSALENTIFIGMTSGSDCVIGATGSITTSTNNHSSDGTCPGDIGAVTEFDTMLADHS